MTKSCESQVCVNTKKQVNFQVEKEVHYGLQLVNIWKYCSENCPLKPCCKQAVQHYLYHV